MLIFIQGLTFILCIGIHPSLNAQVEEFKHMQTNIPLLEKENWLRTQSDLSSTAITDYDLIYHRCNWEIDPSIKYIHGSILSYFKPRTSAFQQIEFDLSSELIVELYTLEDTLEVLDLSVNRLSSLPSDFSRFTKLKIIFCSENVFTELPAVLGDCKHLEMIGFKSNQITFIPEKALPVTTRWLILTNNKIEELPASIGKCRQLQKVALAGNALKALPREMAECKNLELLRISANRLEDLPNWLLHLPKISWLSFAGNTFNTPHAQPRPLNEINWNEFKLQEKLGEGASGNIYKALWHNSIIHNEVAIKLFKGEVTSDGYPDDEMQATIASGKHSNLVGLLGSIAEHPEQKRGLVMELIPPSYKNLGLPPSFVTCTRDTFLSGTQFKAKQILKIAIQMADVANHLHLNGLIHGDIYAHNILINKEDHCLKGDFGAASFYDVRSEEAFNLERIEVRALGCLMDDLLSRVNEGEPDPSLVKHLKDLSALFMNELTKKRPLFSEVQILLNSLRS